MRALPLVAFLAAVYGCGDSDSGLRVPETVRKCGELEGVEPDEPAILGEDRLGCPFFAPVPCARPTEAYALMCGADCWPYTGVAEDGDEWLLGCRSRVPVGCLDLESAPAPPVCVLEPYYGRPLWLYPSNNCEVPPLSLFSAGTAATEAALPAHSNTRGVRSGGRAAQLPRGLVENVDG